MSAERRLQLALTDEQPDLPQPRHRHLTAVPPLHDSDDDAIPEPSSRFVKALATHAFDVIAGSRGVRQLGNTITRGAASQLTLQRAHFGERQAIYRDNRLHAARAGSLRMCRVSSTVVEAAVVLHTAQRSYATAIRLEWLHGKWRASELQLL